jgi:hypothetical protein
MPVKWEKSRAKALLRQAIVDGKVTRAMKRRQVYEMEPEYQEYEFKNFSRNCGTLLNEYEKNYTRANADAAALVHDRTIHPVGPETAKGCGYPRWQGSDAQRLLKEDIDAGRHKDREPQELRQTRMEYQAFPLTVFRDHIHQETRSRLGRSYWFNKNK